MLAVPLSDNASLIHSLLTGHEIQRLQIWGEDFRNIIGSNNVFGEQWLAEAIFENSQTFVVILLRGDYL